MKNTFTRAALGVSAAALLASFVMPAMASASTVYAGIGVNRLASTASTLAQQAADAECRSAGGRSSGFKLVAKSYNKSANIWTYEVSTVCSN